MTENQPDNSIRPGIERRLEFIEYRLYWEGSVNRSDLKAKFGVSQPQASNDLAQYQRLAPGNIRYDSSEKRYVPGDRFEPIFHVPNASHYLVEMRSVADGVLDSKESWSTSALSVGAMPIPGRRVNPTILQALIRAIREEKSIRAYYHSMTHQSPDAIWREITPHAFGFDGLRWHVRAFCHRDGRFKDFVLSRFIDVGELSLAAAPGAADNDWNSYFEVVLKPNPALGTSKMKTVELDYDMREGQLPLSVRCALLYYLDKRLRLDVGEKLDRPSETPIVVANRVAFEAAIQNATGSAIPALIRSGVISR
jgi:predicted DNA-binding transcriptional regulator YafY